MYTRLGRCKNIEILSGRVAVFLQGRRVLFDGRDDSFALFRKLPDLNPVVDHDEPPGLLRYRNWGHAGVLMISFTRLNFLVLKIPMDRRVFNSSKKSAIPSLLSVMLAKGYYIAIITDTEMFEYWNHTPFSLLPYFIRQRRGKESKVAGEERMEVNPLEPSRDEFSPGGAILI
jgi:hypothetical protein